mgnify:CR=1 FL=1
MIALTVPKVSGCSELAQGLSLTIFKVRSPCLPLVARASDVVDFPFRTSIWARGHGERVFNDTYCL